VGQLRSIVEEGTRDAAIAKVLLRAVPLGTNPLKGVRDVVSMETFQRAVQGAAAVVETEVGHVAA
jgi:hypothetical protein